MNSSLKFYGFWFLRLLAAAIMLQTLYFKFSGAEESVYIFSTVGMEPWGRYGIGILELLASVLLIINSTAWLGALLALGLMSGAIVMHLTILGIEIKDDDGYLFILAIIVFASCLFITLHYRKKIRDVARRFFSSTREDL